MVITKRETFLLLVVVAALYLPSIDETTKSFMRSIAKEDPQHQTASTATIITAPIKGKSTTSSLSDTAQLAFQPQPTSRGLFQNRLEVVHVIHTRFMQHQKDLRHLAKARLQMLETITLPSLLQQSNTEFLWILWVDPQLHEEIRREFLALIQNTIRDNPAMNIVVIGSRAKLPDLRADADEFYNELMGSQIHAGSYDVLMDYCEAALSRPLIDTILDADDAIFYDFVSTIQQDAATTLRHSQLVKDFRIWCVPESLYWGHYNPWFESSKRGHFLSQNHIKTTKECPTGAYTRGYSVGTLPSDLPQVPRYQIHSKAPSCEFSKHKCLQRIYAGGAEYAVLRAKTPASVAVAQSLPSKSSSVLNSDWQNRQDTMWKQIQTNFGIDQASMVQMRADMEENMLQIILDGMMGICTEGHSCKRADKDALKALKLQYKYPERHGAGAGEDDFEEEENNIDSASFRTGEGNTATRMEALPSDSTSTSSSSSSSWQHPEDTAEADALASVEDNIPSTRNGDGDDSWGSTSSAAKFLQDVEADDAEGSFNDEDDSEEDEDF